MSSINVSDIVFFTIPLILLSLTSIIAWIKGSHSSNKWKAAGWIILGIYNLFLLLILLVIHHAAVIQSTRQQFFQDILPMYGILALAGAVGSLKVEVRREKYASKKDRISQYHPAKNPVRRNVRYDVHNLDHSYHHRIAS